MIVIAGQPPVVKELRSRRRKNNLHPHKREGSNGYDHHIEKAQHRVDLGRDPNWLRRKLGYRMFFDSENWVYPSSVQTTTMGDDSKTDSIDSLAETAVVESSMKRVDSDFVPTQAYQSLLGTSAKTIMQKYGFPENVFYILYERNVPKWITILKGDGTYDILKQIVENNEFSQLKKLNQGAVRFSINYPTRSVPPTRLTSKYMVWVGYAPFSDKEENQRPFFEQTLFDKNLKVLRIEGNIAKLEFFPKDELGYAFIIEMQKRINRRKEATSYVR